MLFTHINIIELFMANILMRVVTVTDFYQTFNSELLYK
jgi:hypothetical protein